MKQILILLLAITTLSCNAQINKQSKFNNENFEQKFLAYEPEQKEGVSKKDFTEGVMIINNVKKDVKNNPKNFNVVDYLNIMSAFLTLNENEKNVKIAFNKFVASEGSCEYILYSESSFKNKPKYKIILDDYLVELSKCKSNEIVEKSFNIKEYCNERNLDVNLVNLINKILVNDQKFRIEKPVDMSKQNPLDIRNQQLIDSLFGKYNTYIGKSLVGEKFNDVMFLVIQHSNLKTMENYLPITQKAVKEKELGVVELKMLIDRYYGLTYGYQIFGSQNGFGFELADEKKRIEIEKKYEIE